MSVIIGMQNMGRDAHDAVLGKLVRTASHAHVLHGRSRLVHVRSNEIS